jgi:hypothetical protein
MMRSTASLAQASSLWVLVAAMTIVLQLTRAGWKPAPLENLKFFMVI